MTDLSAQKRMAADVLDVGKNRVWLNPERQGDIAEAITRADVRDLVDEGAIRAEEPKGNSRGRARERQEKRAYGHRKGQGSRKGTAGGRENEKQKWVSAIRAQREKLRELRDDGTISRSTYRELYDRASGGEFDSVADIERTIGSEN
ncbi:50S ribosomal protein L19e [Halobacteriales archaeon QH_1_68_42]|nr:MAG: 50S ribosomal protein L19e [Halobacteriales archaeon QH_1_68_42]